jgi:hypothetical protein
VWREDSATLQSWRKNTHKKAPEFSGAFFSHQPVISHNWAGSKELPGGGLGGLRVGHVQETGFRLRHHTPALHGSAQVGRLGECACVFQVGKFDDDRDLIWIFRILVKGGKYQ